MNSSNFSIVQIFLLSLLSSVYAQYLSGRGRGSFYGEGSGLDAPPDARQPGKCGINHLPKDPRFFVALAAGADFSFNHCGRCVRISCDDTKCVQGASVISQFVDECPSSYCSKGQIDMSLDSMAILAGSRQQAIHWGLMNVAWTVIDCPGYLGAVKKDEGEAVGAPEPDQKQQQKTTPSSPEDSSSDSNQNSESKKSVNKGNNQFLTCPAQLPKNTQKIANKCLERKTKHSSSNDKNKDNHKNKKSNNKKKSKNRKKD